MNPWKACDIRGLFPDEISPELFRLIGQGVASRLPAGAKSPVLSQLRANILGRTVVRPRYPTAAFGAAILAATGAVFSGNIFHAIQSMTGILENYSASGDVVPAFDEIYRSFRDACARRGYVA